jgi:hypothetical protein
VARILYAAGNREGSYYQLERYLPLFKGSGHAFQIAGYKKSLRNLNADYCLDALLNFANPNGPVSFNGNFSYYTREIEKFNPNLIISDLEIYTSLYAIEKSIPLWQVSPTMLYYALPKSIKEHCKINSFNLKLISGDRTKDRDIQYILNNSQRRMVLSHLCDIEKSPQLLYGYEWIRPEFKLVENSTIYTKTQGFGVNLADAFYNGQYTMLQSKIPDIETATGINANIYFGLGQLEIDNLNLKPIKINPNDRVKFLMEQLEMAALCPINRDMEIVK